MPRASEREVRAPMRLYRATQDDSPYFGRWSCWAETPDAAEAYTDNPGFGGPALYVADVEPERVLDLTDARRPLRTLAAALAGEDMDAEEVYVRYCEGHAYVYQAWEESSRLSARLVSRYDWVRYVDDYPAGAVTWVSLAETPLSARRFDPE